MWPGCKRAVAKPIAWPEPPAHLSHREPIFNVPRVVMWLLAAFVAVHVVRELLPEYQTGSHGMMDVMVGSPWLTWAVLFCRTARG